MTDPAPDLRAGRGCGEHAHMLVLTLQTEMPLAEPNEEFGFVTWLDVSVRQFDAPTREPIGHARIAVIQVADAMNRWWRCARCSRVGRHRDPRVSG